MQPKLAIVGGLNVDFMIRVPRLCNLGEAILGVDFQITAGGKGANKAVAAAKLGATVKIVGKIEGWNSQ